MINIGSIVKINRTVSRAALIESHVNGMITANGGYDIDKSIMDKIGLCVDHLGEDKCKILINNRFYMVYNKDLTEAPDEN